VTISSATNATLVDSNGITLGGPSTVTGLYDVTADGITLSGAVSAGSVDFDVSGGAGSITDTAAGTLSVTGHTLIDAQAADDVILNSAGNDLVSLEVLTARNVTIVDVNDLLLQNLSLGGTLNITAAGAIGETGTASQTVVVAGTSTFDAGAASDITLSKAGNNFATVVVTEGNDATFSDSNSIILGNIALAGQLIVDASGIDVAGLVAADSADLDATGGNLLDSTGSLNLATGDSLFTVTGTNTITLNAAANDFARVLIEADSAATLVDTNQIVLGTVNVGGLLDVQAAGITVDAVVTASSADLDASGGDLTDSLAGRLVVTGASTLTSTGAGIIELDTGTNEFSSVQINAGAGAVTLVDQSLILLNASNVGGLLDVTADGIDLSGSVVAASVNFDASAGVGNISDSTGDLTVAGATVLAVAASDNIALDAATNDFDSDGSGDAVTVTGTLTNLTLRDEDNIVLGGGAASGTLSIIAAGNVTQTGALSAFSASVDAGAQVPGTNDITLSLGNDFDNVSIVNGVNVTVTDVDDLKVGVANVGGAFVVNAVGLDVTGVVTAGTVDFDAGADDLIDSTGSFDVSGLADFSVSAGAVINLNSASNDFTTVTASSGTGEISIVDLNGISLGMISSGGQLFVDAAGIDLIGSVTAPNVTFDATGGDLTDTGGDLSVTGTANLTTTGTHLITLNAATNDFATVLLSTGTGAATLVDDNDIVIGASTLGGLLDISAESIQVAGILSTGSLDLNVTATGTITIDSLVTTTSGGMAFDSASLLDINADLTSAGSIGATNIASVQLESSTLTAASGGIDLEGGGTVASLTVSGSGAVNLIANGEGDIALTDVADIDDGDTINLNLNAQGSVSLSSVDLADAGTSTTTWGGLTVGIDTNDNGAETLTVSGDISGVSLVDASGSAALNDSMSFAGDVTTMVADIEIGRVQLLTLVGGLESAGAISVTDATTVDLTAGQVYRSAGGPLDLGSSVGTVRVSGTGLVTISTTGNQDILLANVQDRVDGQKTDLTVSSAGDLSTGSINLNDGAFDGALVINVDGAGEDNGIKTATINDAISNVASFTASGNSTDDIIVLTADARSNGAFAISNVNEIRLDADVDLQGTSVDLTNSVTRVLLQGITSNKVTATAGSINIGDVRSTASNLILDSGAGGNTTVGSYSGLAGVDGDIQVLNSNATTFSGSVAAGTVTLSNTTDAITFAGDADINSLVTSGGAYRINFLGASTVINNNVAFSNTGGVTFGDDIGDDVLLDAGATATADINLSGTVRSSGDILTFGDITANNAGTIDTNGAALNLSSLTGASLILDAGNTGLMTISGDIDNLASLTIRDSAGALFQGQIGSSAAVPFTVTNTRAGETITFQDDAHLASFTTAAQGYSVSFGGATNQIDAAVSFLNTGRLTVQGTTTFLGGATKTTGQTELGGIVRSDDAAITLGAITLLSPTEIDTTNGGDPADGGNIRLGSIAGGGVLFLDLNAGATGTITVTGAVNDVPDLEIVNSNGTTFQGTYGGVTPGAVTVTDTSDGQTVRFGGSTHLTGLTTTNNPYSISFTGNSNQIDSAVTFTNTGDLTFGDATSDRIEFTGGVDISDPTVLAFVAGTVSTIGENLNLQTVQVVDGKTATLATGGGNLQVEEIRGTDSDGADLGTEALTINTGLGNVVLSGINVNLPVGHDIANGLTAVTIAQAADVTFDQVTLMGDLVQTNATGTTRFREDVDVDSAVLTGNAFDVQQAFVASGAVTVTNAGDFTISGQDPLTPTAGFSSTGRVRLSAGIDSAAAVSIGGNLVIADDGDILIATGNGDFEVSGSTVGTQGGTGDESLTVDAGTGTVTFNAVLASSGAIDVTGLTALTITDSSIIEFGTIDLIGNLTQTNRATGNTIFNGTVGLAGADLRGTNFIFSNFSTTGALSVDASQTITQNPATTLQTTGLLDLAAVDATLNGLSATGGVNLNISDDAVLNNDQPIALSGSVGGNFTVSANGAISLRAGQPALVLGNDASFTGDQLSVDLSASRDLILDVDGDATISNDQTTTIEGAVTGDLSIVSAGAIAQSGALEVDGLGSLTANGGGITLNNAGNVFDELRLVATGNDIAIVESDAQAMVLQKVDARHLTIRATADVTNANGADIDVTGTTTFDVGGDITLGNVGADDIALNVLELSAGEVQIFDDSADGVTLAETSVDSVRLETQGDLDSQNGVNITVANQGQFRAGAGSSDIDLSDSSNAFGSLIILGRDVDISERDSMNLAQVTSNSFTANVTGNLTGVGVNDFGLLTLSADNVTLNESDASILGQISVDSLDLTSGGDITQSGAAVEVTGIATLDAGGDDILLDGSSNTFGGIDLTGASVEVNESGDLRIEGAAATTLTVTSTGQIRQRTDGIVSVTGLASFDAGANDINLSGENNNFGSVTLSGGSILFDEASNTVIREITAANLTLDAEGSIVDDISTAGIIVTGNAAFTADGPSVITLANQNSQFGTLSLTGSAVNAFEDGDTVLDTVNVTSLTLTSSGSISDVGASSIDVLAGAVLVAEDDIVLGDAANDSVSFGSLDVSAVNAEIEESDSTQLVNVTADNFTLTSAGAITQTAGLINIADTLTLDAATSNITLNRLTNTFNKVNIISAGSAHLVDQTAILLGNIDVTSLDLDVDGTITDDAGSTIEVGGSITLDAMGNDITLDALNHEFGSIEASGGVVSIVESDASVLDQITSDEFSLQSGSNVSQSGAPITVAGRFTISGNSITLNGADNSLGSVDLTGTAIALTEDNATDLAQVSATSLVLTSGGDVTQSGPISVTDLLHVNTAAPVTLNDAGNLFGSVNITGSDVSFTEADDTLLVGLSASSVNATSAGNILAPGRLTVAGASQFNAGANDITLSNVDNTLGALTLSGANVSLVETGETELKVVNATTSLSVSSSGNIIDSAGSAIVAGATVLTTDGDITLGDNGADNVVFASIELDAVDVNLRESDGTLFDDVSAVNLTITSAGDITQSASAQINVTGVSTFDVGAGSISLNNASNTFQSITVAQAGDVSIADTSATILNQINSGTLTLTSGGSITDNGVLTITGLLNLDAGNQNILLDSNGSRFGSISVSGGDIELVEADSSQLDQITADEFFLTSAATVTQAATSVIDILGTLRIVADEIILDGNNNKFGDIDLTADSITIAQQGAIALEAINADALSVTAGGDITQKVGSALNITGLARFDSGTANIVLPEANQFGTLSLTGNAVTVNEVNDSIIAAANVGSLDFTSDGDVTGTGALAVTGLANISANAITLGQAGNTFGSLSLAGTTIRVTESGATVLDKIDASSELVLNTSGAISDTTASRITVADAVLIAGGDISIGTSANSTVNLGTIDVSGDNVTIGEDDASIIANVNASSFSLTAAGAISKTANGTIVVSNLAKFDAGSNSIELNTGTNTIASLSIVGAGSVSLTNSTSISLDDISATTVSLTSAGAITDQGTVNISGALVLDAGANSITLDSVNSSFGSISVTAGDASLVEADASELNQISVETLSLVSNGNISQAATSVLNITGSLSLSGNDIRLDGAANSFPQVQLDGGTIVLNKNGATSFGIVNANALSMTSSGSVSQTGGAFDVNGLLSLNTGSNDISLDGSANRIGQVAIVGGDVTLFETEAVVLQSVASGTLSVTASGDISGTGRIAVTGATSLDAIGGDITLSGGENSFGTLSVTGENATVNEAGNMELLTVDVDQVLRLTTTGSLSDSIGSSLSAGQAILLATQNVVLGDNPSDLLSFGSVAVDAGNVTISEDDGTIFDEISVDNLTWTANGPVTQNQASTISIGDVAIFDAGQNDITLPGSANVFDRIGVVSAGAVSINNSAATILNPVVAGSLALSSGGAITDAGTLTIAGRIDLNAGSQDITLDSANSTFGSISAAGGTVQMAESGASALAVITAEEYSLASTGVVSQTPDSVINVTGTLRISGREVILDGTQNQFGDIDLTGDAIAISQNGPVRLDSINALSLAVVAQGDITQSSGSALDISGLATFDSGTANIVLGQQNSFGTISLTGNSVRVNEVDDTNIASIVANSLNLTSDGDIQAAGVLMVSNEAVFTAIDNDIVLLNPGNQFGLLRLTGENVLVNEADDTRLSVLDAASAATINSGGTITDVAFSRIEGVTVALNANGAITLGDTPNDSVNFVSLDLSGTDARITEDDGVILGNINVSSVYLTVDGEIGQSVDSVLNVDGLALFDSGSNDIELSGSNNQFGSIGISEADVVNVTEVGDTVLADITSNRLRVVSSGSISDTGIITIDNRTTLVAGVDIALDTIESSYALLLIDGENVNVASADDLVLGRLVARSAVLGSDRSISDTGEALISVTNGASLTAQQDVRLGQGDNTVRFGEVSFAARNVLVQESDSTVLVDVDVVDLTYSSNGAITQSSETVVFDVAGDALFEARAGDSDIDLSSVVNNFASLSVIGADVAVFDVNNLEIAGVTADTLSVIAGGNITDVETSSAGMNVVGLASFIAGAGQSDITLTNDQNSFGTVSVTAADATLVESVDIVFAGLEVDALTATAQSIRQSNNSELNVTGNTVLVASQQLNLTNGTNRFGRLDITSPVAAVSEVDGIELAAVQSRTLTLTTPEDVVDGIDAEISVEDEINIVAGGNVTLGDQIGESIELGAVNISGREVSLSEADNEVELDGITASSLTVESAGGISQSNSSVLLVTGDARLVANSGNDDIALTQDNNQIGSVALEARNVSLVESSDDGLTLMDVDVSNLDLVTTGDIESTSDLVVSGDLGLIANDGAGRVSLTGSGNRLNRISIDAEDAVVINSVDSELVNIDVGSLDLTSGGDVSDSDDDEIEVKGLARIDAGETGNIIIGNVANDLAQFGSIDFTADRIDVTQTDEVHITGARASGSLVIESLAGDIIAAPDAVISSVDDAVFTVNRDNGIIDLRSSGNELGQLSMTARDAYVAETGIVVLEEIDVDTLVVQGGSDVSNTDRANISVVIDAQILAGGDIRLGTGAADSIEFNRVSLAANNATLIEDGATVLSGLNILGDLVLTSENSITDAPGAELAVAGLTTLLVNGQLREIVLDGVNNTFGSFDVTATTIDIQLAGDVALANAVATELDITAQDATVSLQESGKLIVRERASIFARNVVFGKDSVSEVGSLEIRTTDQESSSVSIQSDILPRLVADNPTNPFGSIEIYSPNIEIGVAGGAVSIVTQGDQDGGSITLSGIDGDGNPVAGNGRLELIGDVTLDATNGSISEGTEITVVSSASSLGTIAAADGSVDTSFTVNAGAGDVRLGTFVAGQEISNLTVMAANDLSLSDVYVSGNTIDIAVAGDVDASGVVQDSVGDVSITAGGAVTLQEQMSAGGKVKLQSGSGDLNVQSVSSGRSMSLVSKQGNIMAGGSLNSGAGELSMVAQTGITLGSSMTAAGNVTLVSGSGISTTEAASGGINATGDVRVVAEGSVSLTASGSNAVTSGGSTNVTSNKGNVTLGGVQGAGNVNVFSVTGNIAQVKDTTIGTTGVGGAGSVTLSARSGIAISRIDAASAVTLVISETELEAGAAPPTFSRVNDRIPLGQGESTQDIRARGGAISFLAPQADVGATSTDQNFVQRASGGIFYGLENGRFFSDDIGATAILNTIPANVVNELQVAANGATNVAVGEDVDIADVPVIEEFDVSAFQAALVQSSTAVASAGETSASSSSRSTAASQRDDDEDVEEVDELAFQNLKNYDENPQGIRLPDDQDQSFAFDDEGTMYFEITMSSDRVSGGFDTFRIYELRLDLASMSHRGIETSQLVAESEFRPGFQALPSMSGGE
jgi:hypothetical protein